MRILKEFQLRKNARIFSICNFQRAVGKINVFKFVAHSFIVAHSFEAADFLNIFATFLGV